MPPRKLTPEQQDWVNTMANRTVKYSNLFEEHASILRQDPVVYQAEYDKFSLEMAVKPGWRPRQEDLRSQYVKDLEELCSKPATEVREYVLSIFSYSNHPDCYVIVE
jgi:hypothetical protein